MKHVKPRDEFLNESVKESKKNEEFDWKNPIKELIAKVKNFIPKSKISQFIEENREQVESVAKILAGDDGNVDYNKAAIFIKENVKRKKVNEGIDNINFRLMFSYVADIPENKRYGYIEFLQSLSLTEEQYKKLASLIEDVRLDGYSKGYDAATDEHNEY